MIKVTNLVSGYNVEVDILHGIDLQVGEGEIVTILGPNGCGKSTLLKTIAGFIIPRQGEVVICGKAAHDVPVHLKVTEHSVGFVPQTDNVFSTLTVRENILLGGRMLPKSEQASRLSELLEMYPVLEKKINDRAASMSGGERQL